MERRRTERNRRVSRALLIVVALLAGAAPASAYAVSDRGGPGPRSRRRLLER
ncbi:hypothetical protein [Streptomyces tauricus]|uniref:hypothetical protein n=1 Tax=Streptomyces tauricus TaxID=68274 RepID=UPI0033B87F58